jgi:hypothetical protein
MADEQAAAQASGGSATPASTVKPGWQTTEFWLNLLTALVGAVLASGLPSNNKVMQVAGLGAMVLAALGHTVSRTMVKNAAQVLLVGILLLGAVGCSAIDAKTLADFQTGEALILKDMAKYVAADIAAGKTPAIPQAELDAHAAKIKADPRSVDPAEEQAIMAQFQAYIASDPKMSAGTLRAWNGEVNGHLSLFTSVHR